MDQFKNSIASKSLRHVMDEAADAPGRESACETHAGVMRDNHTKPVFEPGIEQKIRECLTCRAPFPSAWSGERICRKCKSGSAWRGGALK